MTVLLTESLWLDGFVVSTITGTGAVAWAGGEAMILAGVDVDVLIILCASPNQSTSCRNSCCRSFHNRNSDRWYLFSARDCSTWDFLATCWRAHWKRSLHPDCPSESSWVPREWRAWKLKDKGHIPQQCIHYRSSDSLLVSHRCNRQVSDTSRLNLCISDKSCGLNPYFPLFWNRNSENLQLILLQRCIGIGQPWNGESWKEEWVINCFLFSRITVNVQRRFSLVWKLEMYSEWRSIMIIDLIQRTVQSFVILVHISLVQSNNKTSQRLSQ